MILGKRVLAIVPARSGSKGIPNKNLALLKGVSLIGRAGLVLEAASFVDARMLSTDSDEYAEEGRRFGLDSWFLRPASLSDDAAGAVETCQHALLQSEHHYGTSFDVILIVEPTSPLRGARDLERVTRLLLDSRADSAVTVSPLASKANPRKILVLEADRLGFFDQSGATVKGRQALSGNLYWRNGVCYALTRECLMDKAAIFASRTVADIITRPVVNIDDPIELLWAEFLLDQAERKDFATWATGFFP
jgi:CMP-N,N'-diacetyllegionaminic acid synthase